MDPKLSASPLRFTARTTASSNDLQGQKALAFQAVQWPNRHEAHGVPGVINRPERTSQAIKPSDTLHSSGSWHHIEFYALQFFVDTHTTCLPNRTAMTFLAYHLQEKVGSTRFAKGRI